MKNIAKEYGKQYLIDMIDCGCIDENTDIKKSIDNIMNSDNLGTYIDDMVVNELVVSKDKLDDYVFGSKMGYKALRNGNK